MISETLNNKYKQSLLKGILLSIAINIIIFIFLPYLNYLSKSKTENAFKKYKIIKHKVKFRRIQINPDIDSVKSNEFTKRNLTRVVKKNIEHLNINIDKKFNPVRSNDFLPVVSDSLTDKNIKFAEFDLNDYNFSAMAVLNNFNSDIRNRQVRFKFRVKPFYPVLAKRMNVEGFVKCKFDVNINGKAEKIRILQSRPAKIFNQSAVESIKKSEFYPEIKNGKPVPSECELTIKFTLTN